MIHKQPYVALHCNTRKASNIMLQGLFIIYLKLGTFLGFYELLSNFQSYKSSTIKHDISYSFPCISRESFRRGNKVPCCIVYHNLKQKEKEFTKKQLCIQTALYYQSSSEELKMQWMYLLYCLHCVLMETFVPDTHTPSIHRHTCPVTKEKKIKELDIQFSIESLLKAKK